MVDKGGKNRNPARMRFYIPKGLKQIAINLHKLRLTKAGGETLQGLKPRRGRNSGN
jgi:hypothetical protein